MIGVLFTAQPDGAARARRPTSSTQATSYGRIVLIGMPGFFIFLIITSMLRGVGDTVTPLLSLVLSIVVGLVVTPALILGWFGLPQLGVDGGGGRVHRRLRRWCWSSCSSTCDARKSPLAPDAELLRHLKIDFKLLRPDPQARHAGRRRRWWSSSIVGHRHRRHRQPLRLGRHGGLWRGQPGAELCAVPGDVDRASPPRSLRRRRSARGRCDEVEQRHPHRR